MSLKKPPCCGSCSRFGVETIVVVHVLGVETTRSAMKATTKKLTGGKIVAKVVPVGQEGDSCSEFFQLFVLHNVAAAAGGEGTRSGDRGQPLISFIS